MLEPLPPSLFHSAAAPSEREKDCIRAKIQESRATLFLLDVGIERLHSSLALLNDQRTSVHRQILQHEAVLSPLRQLPPEIISEIFLYAQAGSSLAWPRNPTEDLPWKLGRVCSYWRTIYLSLPKLWSNIHVDLSNVRISANLESIPGCTQASPHEFLQTCFQRSAHETLTISLRYQPSDGSSQARTNDEKTGELVCLLLATLVKASERWRDVTLNLKHLFTFHGILSLAKDRVPHLESLSLASSGAAALAPLRWQVIDAFLQAPELTRLTLTNIAHPTHHLRMPWGQLKYLHSKGSTFLEGEFSRILKESALLDEFKTEDERVLEVASNAASILPIAAASTGTATLFGSPNTSTATMNGIYLPSLHTLSVTNKSSYISRIFQLITAPSLSSLSIHARTTLLSPEHIITMLQRSRVSLHLRKLEMESSKDQEAVWEENHAIASLLAEVKGLRECVLRVCRASDEIVPRLTIKRRVGGGRGGGGPLSVLGSLAGSYTSGPGYGGYGGTPYGIGMGMANGGNSLAINRAAVTILLPNLESFELHDSFCTSTLDLKSMLQSRISNAAVTLRDAEEDGGVQSLGFPACSGDIVARLKKIKLELLRPATPEYKELDELMGLAAEKGVELSIVA